MGPDLRKSGIPASLRQLRNLSDFGKKGMGHHGADAVRRESRHSTPYMRLRLEVPNS